MIQSIFSAAHIERVAVCQERLSAQAFYDVRHSLGVVGAQICQIARFAEMNFDGSVFAVKIDSLDACFSNQALQLVLKIVAVVYTQVCKKYL